MNKKIWLLSFAIALGLQMQAQRQDDMRQTVEYLASQELGGRYPATHGDTLASEFIVSQLRSMKLKPIVKGKKAESQNKHKNDNKAGDPVKKPIHTTPYGFSFPSGFGSFRVYFGRIAPVVCQVICFLFLHVIIPQSSE